MGNRAGSSPVTRTKYKRGDNRLLFYISVKVEQDLNPSKCYAIPVAGGFDFYGLPDVFDDNPAVGLCAGGMGGDVLHLLQGRMNHMSLVSIHRL